MAKYVCDYEQVTAAGEKLVQAANEMLASTNSYSTSIASDLSGWTGNAKTSFDTLNQEQVANVTAKAAYISEFGEFIKSASQKIQELDDTLATLNI